MINIKANITFRDFLYYNFYKYYRSPFQLIFQLAIVLIVIIWLIVFIIDYPIDSTLNIIAIMCLFQFWIIVPLRIYLSSKKEYRIKKEFHAPIEFTFTLEGIKSESVFSKNSFNWEAIEKIAETQRWFILYFNKHLATIVPLNSFTNSEQIQQFKAIVSSKPQIKTNFK